MDSQTELMLFDQLSGNSRFKGWLNERLEHEYSVLTQMADVDQLKRSQGRAQLLKSMLDLMEKAPTAMRR